MTREMMVIRYKILGKSKSVILFPDKIDIGFNPKKIHGTCPFLS
jgi:hypothetical protein